MAVTGSIYSSYIDNFLKTLTGEYHFSVSDGDSGDAYTLFAKGAFDSIPDGSTINKVNIIFDGHLSRNNTKYWKGSFKINGVRCFPTWDGVYNGYNNLPWSGAVTLWSGEFSTGDLPSGYQTYTHSITGITLEQLKSGLLIQTSYRYVTWFLNYSSDIYIRNFHVTVDYTPPVACTITYDGNGATSGSVAAQPGYVGKSLTLAENGFEKICQVTFNANYENSNLAYATSRATFLGWYTAASGGTKAGDSGESYTPTGNVTLYAHWSAMLAVTLPSPSRDGYTFLGWYTAAEGGTKVGDGGASYTPTGNVTLYAHWEEIIVPPEIISAAITYGGAQVSAQNKVPAGEGYLIAVGIK